MNHDCCPDPDVCDCPCHKPENHTIHCAPCCYVCPECQQRIVTHAYDNHVSRCKASKQNVAEQPPQNPATHEQLHRAEKKSLMFHLAMTKALLVPRRLNGLVQIVNGLIPDLRTISDLERFKSL